MVHTATVTLSDFLLARVAEDEDNAADCGGVAGCEVPDAILDRNLAECEAKRQIVQMHSADHECTIPGNGYAGVYAADGSMPHICPTMLALASIYSDHSDFRPEWRP